MARWRLTAKHYIHASRYGEPTQWVREETSRETGRVNRKTYIVPMYLDPEQPADQNYPGEIIVAKAKGSHVQDIIVADDFVPTKDMEPLDEEAERLSAPVKQQKDPIEGMPAYGAAYGVSYADALLERLTSQLETAARVAPVSSGSPDAVKKLQDEVTRLMDANAKLQAQLATRK